MGALLVLAGLLGLAFLLLAVPVHVEFRLEGLEPFTGRLGIRWLFGLVRFRVPVPRARPAPRPGATPRAAPAPARPRPRARGRHRRVVAALGQAALRRRVYRLAGDLVRAVHLHRLRLLLRIGLGDPADTGRLWAVVGPLNEVVLRNADVRIEPEFVEPVLAFEAEGRVRLVPLRLLVLALAFALSPPTIRALRTLRSTHA